MLVRHPLQPFDPRNFTAGELIGPGPWSFDPVALDGRPRARLAALGRRSVPAPAAAGSGPTRRRSRSRDLIEFAQRPVRAFLRQRLGLTIGRERDDIADGLPVELDGLDAWRVGQNLLDGVLAGIAPREVCAGGDRPRDAAAGRARRAGDRRRLAPGESDRRARRASTAPDIESADARDQRRPPRRRSGLTGTVSGIHGNVLLSVSYSRLGPRQRIAAWVRLLALTAAHPDIPYEAVTIGRGSRARHGEDDRVAVARIPPLARDPARRVVELALEELGKLAALRAEGMREPLPLPGRTAARIRAGRAAGRR